MSDQDTEARETVQTRSKLKSQENLAEAPSRRNQVNVRASAAMRSQQQRNQGNVADSPVTRGQQQRNQDHVGDSQVPRGQQERNQGHIDDSQVPRRQQQRNQVNVRGSATMSSQQQRNQGYVADSRVPRGQQQRNQGYAVDYQVPRGQQERHQGHVDDSQVPRVQQQRMPATWEDSLLNWRQHVLVIIIAALVPIALRYATPSSMSPDLEAVWQKIEIMQRDVATADKTLKGLHTDSGKVKASVEQIKYDVADKSLELKDLQEAKYKLTTELDDVKQDLNDKLQSMKSKYDTLKENMATVSQEVAKFEDSSKMQITSEMKRIENQYKEIQNEFSKKIEDNRNEIETMGDKVNTDIKTLHSDLSSVSDLIKKAEQAKEKLAKEIEKMDDIVELLRVNAFNKGAMLAVVLFLVVAVFALMIAVWTICRRLPSGSHGNGTGYDTGIFGGRRTTSGAIVDRVPHRPPLARAICIISYGEDRKAFNNRLVAGLKSNLSGPLEFRDHVINKHEDIVSLPHCRLMLMCVEFSSRHVIIEEPGIAQGDIRRKTYEAVQKLGATLVILYTRDHDSKNLSNCLYQRDIYCVGSQPELKELNDKKCFYSVFDRFSPHQINCLKQVVDEALQ